ncbi:MAG: YbdK family carboxylate-amine ligase [Gemmatimonadales bacterium]
MTGGQTPVALDASALRERFAEDRPLTFGIEEELMVLHPESLGLAGTAAELLALVPDDLTVKLELPASQLEICTGAHERLDGLGAELASARTRLEKALRGRARLAVAGTHPFAPPAGELNHSDRYVRMAREYSEVARRQLVCGLHVHVAIGGPERALAVHNAVRSHLPELAALAANAPFLDGRDTGMASVRPLISAQLPRQGVPPAYQSWEELAADLRWGGVAGRLEGFGGWWWELRLHALLGTLELRVPDAQSRVQDALAVAATAAGLVIWLCARFDAGDLPPPDAAWRIAENRWSAARHGTRGRMADLQSGALRDTDELLAERLDQVAPLVAGLGGPAAIEGARGLLVANGAHRQRELATELSLTGLVAKLADDFAPGGLHD